MISPSWEAFLAEHFPGYLLPEALVRAMSEEVAAHFLARIGKDPEHLALLRAAITLAARRRARCSGSLPIRARKRAATSSDIARTSASGRR